MNDPLLPCASIGIPVAIIHRNNVFDIFFFLKIMMTVSTNKLVHCNNKIELRLLANKPLWLQYYKL